jgi:hypothetical protein
VTTPKLHWGTIKARWEMRLLQFYQPPRGVPIKFAYPQLYRDSLIRGEMKQTSGDDDGGGEAGVSEPVRPRR